LGDEFEGVISAVTSFGFFVRINDLFVEGLVHVSSLQSDFYIYDANKHRLIGEQKRKVYKLGDEVSIKVMSVNLDDKKIDFILTDTESNQKSDKAYKGARKKYSKRKAKNQTETSSRGGSKTQQLMAQDKSEKSSPTGKKIKSSSKKRKAKAGKKSTAKVSNKKRR